VNIRLRFATGLAVLLVSAAELFAGGSGLNVVVVVNQSSTNRFNSANYYCERRGVPPQNLLRINWTGDNINWTRSDFETNLFNPLVACLRIAASSTRWITLCSRWTSVPRNRWQRAACGRVNATTSALFYGFKSDQGQSSCGLPSGQPTGTPAAKAFSARRRHQCDSNAWLVMMLTSTNLAQARWWWTAASRAITLSTKRYAGEKPVDRLRRVRLYVFDNAVLNVRLRVTWRLPYQRRYAFGMARCWATKAVISVSLAAGISPREPWRTT